MAFTQIGLCFTDLNMKKHLTLYLLFCIVSLSAQTVNNKHCPVGTQELDMTTISGVDIYSEVRYKDQDSISVRCYVADSDNYSDVIIKKVNKRKYRVLNIEYSPREIELRKGLEFTYKINSGRIKINTLYLTYPGKWHGIPHSLDWGWTEEYFSKVLNEDFYKQFCRYILSIHITSTSQKT